MAAALAVQGQTMVVEEVVREQRMVEEVVEERRLMVRAQERAPQ